MKVVTVVGARPQFIKSAIVSRSLRRISGVKEVLVHTGQHYDHEMSGLFFNELGLSAPHFYLGVGSGKHGAQTGRMLEVIESVLLEVQPDWVIVYGDTNSTLAGALAGAKLQHKLAHVEAGLRSFNRRMPEEINRVVTDHLSDLLFTPTATATRNLEREGIPASKICQVGDVMYDVALFYASHGDSLSQVPDRLGLRKKSYILATIHRAENTDDSERLQIIFKALADVATEIPVVVPLHPRTRASLKRQPGLNGTCDRIQLIDPIGYLEMTVVEKNARLIVTDSGGVQKEAFFHKVPCVTLRHETEWLELVECGANRLVPPTTSAAVSAAIRDALHVRPQFGHRFYGDGNSSQQIAAVIAGCRE